MVMLKLKITIIEMLRSYSRVDILADEMKMDVGLVIECEDFKFRTVV